MLECPHGKSHGPALAANGVAGDGPVAVGDHPKSSDYSSQVTELEAVAAFCAGDERGFEQLVGMFERRAFGVAVVIVRDAALADDIVSEAFLKAYRFRSRLDPNRAFWPWLVTIVVNEARSAARRRSRRVRLGQILALNPSRPEDPVALAEENELARWLLHAILALPIGEREVVHLRFLLDMDEKSIAEVLGCPLGTVKTRLHRARRRLRERASRELEGYIPDSLTVGADGHV